MCNFSYLAAPLNVLNVAWDPNVHEKRLQMNAIIHISPEEQVLQR